MHNPNSAAVVIWKMSFDCESVTITFSYNFVALLENLLSVEFLTLRVISKYM